MEYVVPADSTQPLEAIAAQYQIGLTNMLEANPGVDPYLPRPGSTLIIPHQLILPDAPERHRHQCCRNAPVLLPEGVRTWSKFCPLASANSVPIPRKTGSPRFSARRPIRPGRLPPRCTPNMPPRIEPLPAVWPAGQKTPWDCLPCISAISMPSMVPMPPSLIGLRVSHGCVRLRNDDIQYLFKQVSGRHSRSVRQSAGEGPAPSRMAVAIWKCINPCPGLTRS